MKPEKTQNRVYNGPPFVPIPTQINPVHATILSLADPF